MDRAAFLAGIAAVAAMPGLPKDRLAALESRYGGRLGVAAHNAATGARLTHRADARFAMCSTFKLLLVAAVLARVDAGRERLDRRIAYGKADLVGYAPVSQKNLASGSMTLRTLCGAAIEYSDNTAANLMLATIGGPAAFTAYARSLGDAVTRLDRYEPAMSDAVPGDPRDTTSPGAMVADLRRLLIGDALSAASRRELQGWMIACKTGLDCIRAGIPASWRAGDKTGSGGYATRNDLAALYPPSGAPIFVAAYYTGSSATRSQRDGILAAVGGIVSAALAG
jgi:beta-lactamase class A